MRVISAIFGIILFIPFLVVSLIYLVLGLFIALIFSIAECFIKDEQSHGRNNLNRFESVANGFLEMFKGYFETMFFTKK